jgi:hypothetical protein
MHNMRQTMTGYDATALDVSLWIVAHTLPPTGHSWSDADQPCPILPTAETPGPSAGKALALCRIVDQVLLEKTAIGDPFGERVDPTIPPGDLELFRACSLYHPVAADTLPASKL